MAKRSIQTTSQSLPASSWPVTFGGTVNIIVKSGASDVQLIEQLSTAFVSQSFEHSIHLASYYATKRIACHGRRKTAQKDVTPAMIAETPTSGATIAGRGRSFSAAMTIATTIITSGFMIPRVS